jgi:hypothetical protein
MARGPSPRRLYSETVAARARILHQFMLAYRDRCVEMRYCARPTTKAIHEGNRRPATSSRERLDPQCVTRRFRAIGKIAVSTCSLILPVA